MKTQNNSIANPEQRQINTPIISNQEHEESVEQETEHKRYSTLELVATAGAMLDDARAAILKGDTETALDIIDMADCQLHDVYARIDFVANFMGGLK